MDLVLFGFACVYLAGAGILAAIRVKSGWTGAAGIIMGSVFFLALGLGGYLMYLSFTLPKGA